ncbi:unnamed protein product [Gadus morhua 'NCC']
MDGPRSGSALRKKRKSRAARDKVRGPGRMPNGHAKSSAAATATAAATAAVFAKAGATMVRFSSDSEREGGLGPAVPSARPRPPPRRKRKESTSDEEDIIDGFCISGFISLEALEKDESGKPQDRTEDDHNNLAVPLHKKKVARVPNGLTLDPCKNNHHHTHQYHNHNHNRHNHNHLPSDQENNNPRLTHTAGKRKKKHLHKKHTAVEEEEAEV